VFIAFALLAVALPLGLLLLLLGELVKDGVERLSWQFLTSYPSRRAELAGILPALTGSLWLISLTALMTLPVGVGAAIYLEEYARGRRGAKLDRDQYRQPGRRSLRHLRPARARGVCAAAGPGA
jgi:phosphate transport system permease protein